MDYWSYLPFLQFIRDDKETVTIMAEAMQIVPTVCKILQAPRSNERNTPQPLAGLNGATTVAPSPSLTSTSNVNVSLQDMGAASSLVTLSRKRKRPEEANSSTIMYPFKKRKLMGVRNVPASDTSRDHNQPSTSAAAAVANREERAESVETTTSSSSPGSMDGGDQLAIIRLKLKEDYDKFVDQVGQLASLERQKNTLIQKFVQLCTAASLSTTAAAGTSGSGAATNTGETNPPESSSNSIDPATPPASSTTVDNDHSYASPSPPSA